MQEQDRRQYFRIDQRVSLELKVIDESEIEHHPSPTQFGVSPNFLLLSELQEIDTQSQHLLRKISEKDSNVASFLQIMHDKIERIAQAIASNEMVIRNSAIQEVNLSEGGIQFRHKEPFNVDSFLSVKLVFPESCLGLLIYAQCCRSEAMADGSFMTGIEFIKMPESCRMILARQIFESQARLKQQEPELPAEEN
ncbi:PilZ domain-containing protein [Neptuniibacter sp. 1_MG-2023]|uniref:PilZ domain-containing protein n=1 Tax=Neptuniibacter sp. 1_MG-2023 TaxID=3062662 RepID=UPI0026E306BF|nr:PilZ domain-containing protein [Neptuniibacter sp. 1_MG-2023]MDO6595061.1 PilZ domain-containing protein [Neptuniibacter sp. 1_MG-2023]